MSRARVVFCRAENAGKTTDTDRTRPTVRPPCGRTATPRATRKLALLRAFERADAASLDFARPKSNTGPLQIDAHRALFCAWAAM
jgi:hypothetical protein